MEMKNTEYEVTAYEPMHKTDDKPEPAPIQLTSSVFATPNMISDNPEIMITLNNLLGLVAKWAVTLHPYHQPPYLDQLLWKLREEFCRLPSTARCGNLLMIKMRFADIRPWLKHWLSNHREFTDWNIPLRELNFQPVRASEDYSPYNDFIGLDAFIQNMANDIGHEYYIDKDMDS